MKIIEKLIPVTRPLPQVVLSYLPDKKLAVFDIETTGLSPAAHSVILIGLLLIRKEDLLIRQYFAESLQDEVLILKAFCQDVTDVDLFFSYNGDSFDIPFIRKRCQKLHIDFCADSEKSMDLYRILRGTYFKTMLPDLRQKTVERLFSQDRTDELDSAECVSLYRSYLRGQNADEVTRRLLLHNYDDVRLLYEMLQAFAKIDVHALMFGRGFFVSLCQPATTGVCACVQIRQIKMQHGVLSFQANAPVFDSYRDIFLPAYHFVTDPTHHRLIADIPFQHEHGLCYLDLIPLELDKPCASLPGFHSGFLMLSKEGLIDHLSVNVFIREFFCKIMLDYDIL